jgi:hypothetical protein
MTLTLREQAAIAIVAAQIEDAPAWATVNCSPEDLSNFVNCAIKIADALVAQLAATAPTKDNLTCSQVMEHISGCTLCKIAMQ